MDNIDRKGTFIGTVTESTVGVTKSGLPQWVARLVTTKKWADSTEELAHYQLTEPGYVDYPDQTIVAFLCLFGKENQPLFSFEQVQLATKWDGQSFDTLAAVQGVSILFRVEDKVAYTNASGALVDKGGFEVSWVDDVNSPAERQLKKLDATVLSGLNAKFLSGIKKPAAPPKPAVAAAKPLPPKQIAAPVTAPVAASVVPPAVTALATVAGSATAKPKKTVTKPPTSKPPVVEAPTSLPISGLPGEQTQEEAWVVVCSLKGDLEDSVVADNWVAACNTIGGGKPETEFTNANWAAIRDLVITKLELKPALAA